MAIQNSPFARLLKTAEGVGKVMGGDVMGGVGALGQGLGKEGSPIAKLGGVAELASDVKGAFSGGPTGKRDAMGGATLGVNTDLGYGATPTFETPGLGSSMRRRAMAGPSLLGKGF